MKNFDLCITVLGVNNQAGAVLVIEDIICHDGSAAIFEHVDRYANHKDAYVRPVLACALVMMARIHSKTKT